MPDMIAPGVYIEEVPAADRRIIGVDTNTAGFVGLAARGPLALQLLTSWPEFLRLYGAGIPAESFLAYAVEGFFNNGGQRCYVTRIARPDAVSSHLCYDGKLNIIAAGPGRWGNGISIQVEQAGHPDQPGWIKLNIIYNGNMQEVFDNLPWPPDADNNLVATINRHSQYIRVWLEDGFDAGDPLATSPTPLPLTGGADGEAGYDRETFVGHNDDHPAPRPGNTAAPEALLGRGTGLAALESRADISLLIVPDQARQEYYESLAAEMIAHCERAEDRFALLSVNRGRQKTRELQLPAHSANAAFYYPWIKVYDTAANQSLFIPPVGHIAGIIARTDDERGVFKAPANEIVRGVLELEFPVTNEMQGELNPRGINCIRDFSRTGRGIRLWGARTMSNNPDWQYINVRRLFLYLVKSIDLGLNWVVFEPNVEATWDGVDRQVGQFLTSVWRAGGLMGQTPADAFFVRCDRTTMTQEDIDLGLLVVVVGVAPLRPAEFVIFTITKKTVDAP